MSLQQGKKPLKIISFGEVLWDILPDGEVLGGAPCNFAYKLLSTGAEVRLVSRVGSDEYGIRALHKLAALGLSTDFVQQTAAYATGTVSVSVDKSGNPSYVIHQSVAYDHIESSPDILDYARACDCIAFGTLCQRNEQSRGALAQILEASPSSTKFLDINLRKDCYSPESIRSSLEHTNILKLNKDELIYLSELFELDRSSFENSVSSLLQSFNLDCVVVTRGEKGVFAVERSGKQAQVAGFRVNVVDLVGAGDAFAAGFLSSYLQGEDLFDACEKGNLLGALAAASRGATSAPDEELRKALMQGQIPRFNSNPPTLNA